MVGRGLRVWMGMAFAQLVLLAAGASAQPSAQTAPAAAQHPLIVIEQHRASVVQRIVGDWTDVLAALPKERALTPQQLSEALWTLRSDRLLAASLAGSFAAIESILADDRADRAWTMRVAEKDLGAANADLTYTPINPCRIADTRLAGGALAANTGRTFNGFAANFAGQGGTATNCGMPNGVAAIAMNVYAVNPTNLGFIKVYPANGAEPAVSTVNYQTGIVAIATGAIVPVDAANSNRFTAKSSAQVDFIADVVGYFRSPSGNIVLPQSTSASVGNIMKVGNPFIHNFGPFNTFVGETAGNFTLSGGDNAAFGYGAMKANTTGAGNTAAGVEALFNNTTGNFNVAVGDAAMLFNTVGSHNTAVGYTALYNHDSGDFNTAVGDAALFSNVSGQFNTAVGHSALAATTMSLYNTAIGREALVNLTVGDNNIAIGDQAGFDLQTGDNNVYIGSLGQTSENNTIRIGESTDQNRAFVAGIRGVQTGIANAVAVVVDGNGQLGTLNSSARVKDDIADMDDASAALMKLRPVTFHYKADHAPAGRTLQYGLVAEEVDQVAPGLVAHAANGEAETVYYQFLPPMLLNEYQKQQRTIEAQAAALAKQGTEIAELRHAVETLMARTALQDPVVQAR